MFLTNKILNILFNATGLPGLQLSTRWHEETFQ